MSQRHSEPIMETKRRMKGNSMFKQYVKTLDYKLLTVILILCGIGSIMVFSASSVTAITRFGVSKTHFFNQQVIAIAAGGVLFLVFSMLPYHVLKKRVFIYGNIGLTFILMLIAAFFSDTQAGVYRWVNIGGFQFQPSEFIKIAVIVVLAASYSKKQPYINSLKNGLLPPLFYVLIVFAGVFLQRDLGTSLLILGIAACMVLGAGMEPKKMFYIAVLGSIGAIIIGIFAYFFILEDYQLDRFTASFDPFSDVRGVGFQPITAYMAMTNGGLFGRGLGNSLLKFGRLPEAHTDYIIAIIAEELGFVGVCLTLGSLAFIAFRSIGIAKRCPDAFGSLLAIGISAFITLQSFINIGGITGMIPMTGIPLPFISYGGSSIIATLFGMGILMSVSRYTKSVTVKEKVQRREAVPKLQVVK